MKRSDGRQNFDLRPVKITRNYIKHAEGSALIEIGETKVICTASVDEKTPGWMKNTGKGWVTAEYGLLPRSTKERNPREATKGKISGRTQEIMRLIGRALRSIVDLNSIGERTILIDCDVIQADGGTRTASVTGSFVAMVDAFAHLQKAGIIKGRVLKSYMAAVSVGIINNEEILDLNYEEDSRAQVDMNVIMTSRDELVEVQGTAEGNPFSKKQLYRMVDVAQKGIRELITVQKEVLTDIKGLIWPDDITPPPV